MGKKKSSTDPDAPMPNLRDQGGLAAVARMVELQRKAEAAAPTPTVTIANPPAFTPGFLDRKPDKKDKKDRKDRKDKKHKRKSGDRDDHRISAVSGKRIKMKVDKSKQDLALEDQRANLLAYLNDLHD